MSESICSYRIDSNLFYPFVMILLACFVLPSLVYSAGNPYEMLPRPDGSSARANIVFATFSAVKSRAIRA